jgi:hypothetical protein
MTEPTPKPRAQRRREARATVGAPSVVVVPTGPPVIEIPPMGLELFQASQAAAQRFQDWITGFLAGQGHSANYSLQAVPGGLRLVRQADQAPTPSPADQDQAPVN